MIWSKPLGKTPGYLVPSPVVLGDQLLLCGENGAQVQKLGAQGKLPEEWDGRNKEFMIGDATPTPAGGMALAVVAGKGLTALEISKDLKILWETGERRHGMPVRQYDCRAMAGRWCWTSPGRFSVRGEAERRQAPGQAEGVR